MVELVRERHQQRAADAGLEVLLGDVLRLAGEDGGERLFVRVVHIADRDDVEFDAEVLRQRLGVGDGAFGAEAAGHGDADDFVLSQ